MRFVTRIAAACVAATLFTIGAATPGATLLQRNVVLVSSPHVAIDLQLSQTQTSQRDQLLAGYQSTRDDIVKRMQAATDAQRDLLSAELDKAQEDLEMKLLSLLTPTQTNRLKQIGIQQEQLVALQDDVVAKDLALTAAQRTKIKTLADSTQKAQDDYQGALGEALSKLPDPGSEDTAVIEQYHAKQQAIVKSMAPREKQFLAVKAANDKLILAVLTPAQRNKWTAMHGKPLKGG